MLLLLLLLLKVCHRLLAGESFHITELLFSHVHSRKTLLHARGEFEQKVGAFFSDRKEIFTSRKLELGLSSFPPWAFTS